MDLKCKKVTMFECNYGDFNDFITAQFGQEFEIAADQECGNDSSINLGITGTMFDMETKTWVPGIDDYDREQVDKFKATGEYFFIAGTLMNYLCVEGKVEPGEYLIQVCW